MQTTAREADFAKDVEARLYQIVMTLRLLVAFFAALCASDSFALAVRVTSPATHTGAVGSVAPCPRVALRALRGGAAEDEDEDDDLEEELDESAGADDDTLENPFLAGGAGGEGSEALSELAQSLKDPSLVREALKELQDPEAQARMKAMMEDPEFQQSMKQYVEQISKDPQFEQLRAQTEQLMQEPDFLEQISKAFAGFEPPTGGKGE